MSYYDTIATEVVLRSDLKPAIISALISAKRFDLWVPSEGVYELPDASFLCEYFRCVGMLLEDGQSAKSLELRAATSLAELWRTQGRFDEARALLEPICRWFDEEDETADLKRARGVQCALH